MSRLIAWNVTDSRNGNVVQECHSNCTAHTVKTMLNRSLSNNRYEVKLAICLCLLGLTGCQVIAHRHMDKACGAKANFWTMSNEWCAKENSK